MIIILMRLQVLLVIGMGLVAYFTKELHDDVTKSDMLVPDPFDAGNYGRQEFYLYSTSVGLVLAVVGLVCVINGVLQTKHGALAVSKGQ
jgi:hypothetical protein